MSLLESTHEAITERGKKPAYIYFNNTKMRQKPATQRELT